jgi:formylglycine-generating enzyme required for sulfatase activity/tRNA A-37 threonylcarbamoyl transferase component Bud32
LPNYRVVNGFVVVPGARNSGVPCLDNFSGLRRVTESQVIADRYELAGMLGSRSGTLVFRAHDLLSGEEIAIKLFRAGKELRRAALKRFKRDLAVVRDNAHPNIVRILDFGETGDDFYLAMELMRGAPLSRHVDSRTGWSHGAALEVFEQVTNALAWLHSRGIVHGDIRMSNIVWNDGALRLMDFGPQRDSRLLGRPVTAASDLYSAAAVVYDLLAGEPPHAKTAPHIRERAAHIPEEVAMLLESCLNPDPALRPASAAEIAGECRRRRGDLHPLKQQMAGPVLSDRMGEQPVAAGEVLALLLGICGVLRNIHDAGLSHPDLAPPNIRVSADGKVDIDTLPAATPNATLIVIEPKYTAPEVLLTHTTTDGTAHIRTDIYVLGFVSYEALAGRDAFHGQLFGDSGEPETDLFWMKWHADRAACLQPLNIVNPSVPQELSTLIQRMTAKDPAARLGSLEDLESALLQLQRRLETTGEVDLAPVERSASPPPDQRRRQIARAFILIGLLGCGGAAWWLSRPGIGVRPIATAWSRVREFQHRAAPSPSATPLATSIETPSGPMVLVPAGRFTMGSSVVPNEAPVHTVYLSAFYIDKFEVSNGRYRAFTDSTGYSQPPAPSWDPEYFAKSSHPVLNVSWRDAQAFCIASGKRLPTEAEWEKAARGTSPSSRLWANWTVEGLANLKRTDPASPAQVGSFAADVSPFGAFDMAGNVHEWVNDHYGLYDGNPISLERPGNAKVVRGGSFALAPVELSPSWRASLEPSIAPGSDSPVGFRCAADPGSAVASDGSRQPVTPPREQSRP